MREPAFFYGFENRSKFWFPEKKLTFFNTYWSRLCSERAAGGNFWLWAFNHSAPFNFRVVPPKFGLKFFKQPLNKGPIFGEPKIILPNWTYIGQKKTLEGTGRFSR